MTVIDAIRDKDVFGSLAAFQSLDTWASWLVWLRKLYTIVKKVDQAVYDAAKTLFELDKITMFIEREMEAQRKEVQR